MTQSESSESQTSGSSVSEAIVKTVKVVPPRGIVKYQAVFMLGGKEVRIFWHGPNELFVWSVSGRVKFRKSLAGKDCGVLTF